MKFILLVLLDQMDRCRLYTSLNKRVIRLKDGRVQSDNMRGAEINEA